MIPRTGGAALTWARGHRRWPVGYCLQWVRSCYGIQARYPSAIVAWQNATMRRPGDLTPPPGVPVFWRGGRYGHVALSAGWGECWSTDARTPGQVDKVRILDLSRRWGYTPLGWSADLNGAVVFERPRVRLEAVRDAARRRRGAPYGRWIKKSVAAEVGRGRMDLSDDVLGRAFRRRYKRWQRAQGFTRRQADGIPGKTSLAALGARHHFDVR